MIGSDEGSPATGDIQALNSSSVRLRVIRVSYLGYTTDSWIGHYSFESDGGSADGGSALEVRVGKEA